MAAEAVSSTPEAQAALAPEAAHASDATGAVAHGAAGPVTLDAILSTTGPDPQAIARTMVARGKTTDPRLWTDIHTRLGNSMAVQIKSAIDHDGKLAPTPVEAEVEAATTATTTPGTATTTPGTATTTTTTTTPGTATTATATETEKPAPIASVTDTGEVLPAPYLSNIFGVELVAPAGVRVAAVQDCVGFIQAEVGKNEYAQEHFKKAKVQIVIIPAKVPMTDVEQFNDLKGKQTFDGRPWEGVRGSGGTQTHDGHYAVAIAEESIVSVKDALSNYPATYSVGMHELAHVLEEKGMTDEQQARVKELYDNHHKADPDNAKDSFTDEYAAKNEREYWANSTNAFFGRNQMGKNHSGRQWLQENDPDMYAFCVEIYETSRDKKGKPAT